MIELLKLTLRITDDDFVPVLEHLMHAAEADLVSVGVSPADHNDPLFQRAIIVYVEANFGNNPNRERLLQSYDDIKGQLQHTTGYTDWGENA